MRLKHVILSGCSGGGKSTLLAELARRGFAVVSEPGRRIVKEELRSGGAALPWVDLAAFARRAIKVAANDKMRMAAATDWVFFDRSLVDAAVALQYAGEQPAHEVLAHYDRYHGRVFMTPPWPEIYIADNERPHDIFEAIGEYERLLRMYRELGYDPLILPKVEVSGRADFVLSNLGDPCDLK